MAIGSLLVINLGPAGVFTLGAVAAVLTALYASVVIPAEASRARIEGELASTLGQLRWELVQALRSRSLLATIGLVGLPAKAVLTGVIVFALPLLMTEQGYRQEDIGQMLMIYAGGVIVASSAIARLVDRTGRTGLVLGLGGVASGFGLLLIAFVDTDSLGHGSYAGVLQVVLMGLGILIVGAAHGLINAPIVTHVAELGLAKRIGAGAATAAYRFLERGGHVAGPLLVGHLILLAGQIGVTLQWIGTTVAILGLAFLALQRRHAAGTVAERRGAELLALHLDPPDLALLLAVGEEEPAPPVRPGRMLRVAGPPRTTSEDPDRVHRLRAFLAPLLATVPPGTRLRLVGCGDPASYRAALADAAGVELRCAPNAAAWLAELRPFLVRETTAELARALADHGQRQSGPDRPFVWIRASTARPRAELEPASAT